ncbi:MAG: hypothetical protein HUK21_11235 [Fibrobacteraceae bacterium]|nr:hypothetical protein [Fibrobacteraceae bacterium]
MIIRPYDITISTFAASALRSLRAASGTAGIGLFGTILAGGGLHRCVGIFACTANFCMVA